MARFTSYDGTELFYTTLGSGHPLVCVPGGPARTPDYLGDLGGLAGSRELVLLHMRGTGESADPANPATYRSDRLAADVEALRAHLGLERMDLAGHSATGNVVTLYAAAYPHRLANLVLLTPGLRAVGLELTKAQTRAAMRRRSGEPWYTDGVAAAAKFAAGDNSLDTLRGYLPFYYGRWDETAQAHAFAGFSERSGAAREGFHAPGAYHPQATRASLQNLTAPVLIYIGELDIEPTAALAVRAARLFPHSEVVVQPGGGHFPWVDDPDWFRAAVTSFLG